MGFHEFDTELERHYQRLFEQDWADARERLGDAAATARQRRRQTWP